MSKLSAQPCGAVHPQTGAVCELPPGHIENHLGQFAHGFAQWPDPVSQSWHPLHGHGELTALRAERDRLLVERQQLTERLDAAKEAISSALDEHEATRVLKYRISELNVERERLRGYVRHSPNCHIAVDHVGEYINCYRPLGGCTCGLSALLDGSALPTS